MHDQVIVIVGFYGKQYRSQPLNHFSFSQNRVFIEDILENPTDRNDAASYERKLKTLFRTCLDGYSRAKDGGKHLMELIQDKIGGWWGKNPDDTAWVDWDFNDAIANTMGDLKLFNYLRHYVGQDLYDKTKNSIRVRPLLVQNKHTLEGKCTDIVPIRH